MEMQTSKEISAAERERRLWAASGQYMRGEISGEQLAEIERRYDLSLKKAVLTLAKRNRRQQR